MTGWGWENAGGGGAPVTIPGMVYEAEGLILCMVHVSVPWTFGDIQSRVLQVIV